MGLNLMLEQDVRELPCRWKNFSKLFESRENCQRKSKKIFLGEGQTEKRVMKMECEV